MAATLGIVAAEARGVDDNERRENEMGITESEKIMMKMNNVLAEMRQMRPNDRSEADRGWAIAITDYEKAIAVFLYFVVGREAQSKANG